jgi:uncharacterized protein (TIGR02001 family)
LSSRSRRPVRHLPRTPDPRSAATSRSAAATGATGSHTPTARRCSSPSTISTTRASSPTNLPYQERDIETSAYVGYHGRGERWSWTVSGGRYWYPGADDYDYDEWSASVGFRDRVFYTASYNAEFYSGTAALNQEVAVAFPLPRDFELGGAVGYFDIGGGPQITHWNVGASKLVGPMALDLRYYDGNYATRGYLGDPAADQYVLSFSYALKRNPSRNRR